MNIRQEVITRVKADLSGRFRVVDNTGQDKKVFGGQFPDVLLLQLEPPPNNNVLFILKIEEDGTRLIDSVSDWKGLASTSSVLYVILPKNYLDDGKKLAATTGLLKVRFAWYETIDSKTVVHYE